MEATELNNEEKIYFFFNSLTRLVFGREFPFKIEKHRFLKDAYVVLLPAKEEGISHLIGRQGRVINSLNVLISVWAYKNNVSVFIKQQREKNQEQQENNQ
jgi:predicted RNA-binding protein YlqC (UPF0109 family)